MYFHGVIIEIRKDFENKKFSREREIVNNSTKSNFDRNPARAIHLATMDIK